MPEHTIGTREEWQAARDKLAKLEAEQAKRNEEVKQKRLELPWVPVEKEYEALVHERGFATARGHTLSAEDQLRRDVIVGLMCNGVLKKRDIEERHGVRFDETFASELVALKPLEDDGLVRLEPDALRLTPLGQMFMRNVALPFDRYFAARKARGEASSSTFSKTL